MTLLQRSRRDGFEQKRRSLIDKFVWLEGNLSRGPYFAGERFSLVDAVYGPIFRYFDTFDAFSAFHFSQTLQTLAVGRAGITIASIDSKCSRE